LSRLARLAAVMAAAAVLLSACVSGPSIDWRKSFRLSAGIGTLSEAQWKADCDTLMRGLEARHPDPWHAVSRARFLEALDAPIPADLAPEDLARARWTSMTKALALIKEGHTRLLYPAIYPPRLPVSFSYLSDGCYVVASDASAEALLGGRLVSVDGLTVDELRIRLRPYLGAENDGYEEVMFCETLPYLDALKDAGIAGPSDRTARISVERDGAQATADVAAAAGDDHAGMRDLFTARGITPAQTIARGRENYWFVSMPDRKAILVQYNACAETPGKPFKQFCAEVFAAVDREKPDRLILDLRNNGGGDSALFTFSFLPRIKASYLNRPGGIIVLIGPRVYSSGVFAVADMRKGTRAILMGGPTGQGYRHYGMTARFMLPASGLVAQTSSRLWRLMPGDAADQVTPDVPFTTDARERLAGKDPLLEAALDYRP
jgi:hypothetical protein